MKSLILAAMALAGIIPAAATAQQDLAQRNGCLNCHAVESGGRRMPASSMQELAKKYGGQPDAAAKLTDGLLKGTTNHPPVRSSPEDTKAIVNWILTLK